MSALVTMKVGPVDWEKFRAATEWLNGQDSPGLASSEVYRSEADPGNVLVVQKWDSHDSMHAVSERVGPEFNRRAGTEGLDWETGVWALSDAPAR
jgi:heme-degrading monooxygenase HmoA